MATEEYSFEAFRSELVDLVEAAREQQDEEALARVLDRIAGQARVDLGRVNERTEDPAELTGQRRLGLRRLRMRRLASTSRPPNRYSNLAGTART